MDSPRSHDRPTAFDWMLTPIHRWIWRNAERRVQKLLRFGETETDGGRDILRAAEVTSDPLLRRLYREHAIDEFRHGVLFRRRAAALLRESTLSSNAAFQGDWLAPERYRRHIWRARLSRLWRSYLRLAAGLAGIFGSIMLTIQYFVLLPPFAWFAKRAERREHAGWIPVSAERQGSLDRQY